MKAKRRRRLRPLLFVIPVLVGALSGLTCDALVMAREHASRTRCKSNFVIGLVCHHYAEGFGGNFPPTIGHLYWGFISDGKCFLCPSAGKATPLEVDPCFSDGGHFAPDRYTPAMFGDTHTDYVYVSGLRADDPHTYVLIFDDEWNHDGEGINVCTIGLEGGWTSDIKSVHDQLAKQEKELAAQGRKMKILRPAWSAWPDPPPGGRSLRSRHRVAVAVGALAAVAVALALVVRTVRQGRERRSNED